VFTLGQVALFTLILFSTFGQNMTLFTHSFTSFTLVYYAFAYFSAHWFTLFTNVYNNLFTHTCFFFVITK
jgi:hypothetical protein